MTTTQNSGQDWPQQSGPAAPSPQNENGPEEPTAAWAQHSPHAPQLQQAYYGAPPMVPAAALGQVKKVRLGKLAWASLILGIVGLIGSFVPILGYVTMFAAVVGGVLGIIAFFGSRKVLSAIGVVLCVLAVIITVAMTKAFVEHVDKSLGSTGVAADASGAKDQASGSGAASKVSYKFGETVKFADGSTLRVQKPVAFTPDQWAVTGTKKPVYVKFKATFTNKTQSVYDPSLTDGSASADGEEGESVYQDGLGTPDNKILPGKSVSWWMGYGVTSQKDLQLEVNVGFLDYDTVIFTN